MYKKLSLDELRTYHTLFFKHLKTIMVQEKVEKLSDLFKKIFRYWQTVYYFDGNQPNFRIIKESVSDYILYDEQERIHLCLDSDSVHKLHNMLKNIKQHQTAVYKNLLENLIDEFLWWWYRTIGDKAYLVYDIETPIATNDLSKLPFALWYVTVSNQDKPTFQASYIARDNLQRFVDFVLEFDGYIVGYNNIWFDNPVIAYNVWYTEEQIQIINQKSLDLFQVMYNLTGKRIWLNKLSTALIGLKKTLEWGWAEWSTLLKQYMDTGDEKALSKVKEYCKNDVKMTLGVLLYLMKFGKIQTEDGEYLINTQDLIDLWQEQHHHQASSPSQTHDTMFQF
jgi:uncharacterized protein YprB with RNaseH-like and TPR domain